MKTKIFLLMIPAIFTACGNDDDEQQENNRVSLLYEFSSDAEGWEGDFSDYPVGDDEAYQLQFEHMALPGPLDNTQRALKLSGLNHSDDLFMFVKKQVTDLIPNREYQLNFTVEFASDQGEGQFGIGGSPGESVYLKVGATPQDLVKTPDEEGWYRLNIDKGNQAQGGEDMVVIGNFTNGSSENVYTLKTLSNTTPLRATASGEGKIWIIFGTDSGF